MDHATITREPGAEPIPGYRLLQPLGKGGFGEVWKCEAPGGLLKAIKFVQGTLHALDSAAPADEELRAIQRVKAIRHPFILSMERVESVDGELVIVLELADRSLADLLQAEQQAGRPGIPREVLLAYLREAAEALDVMNVRYDLQHLDIKPQNLFLVSNHVKVGDFGLVSSLAAPAAAGGHAGRPPTLQLGAITPIYASPEVFQGTISRHSDQYSLAIVYQELLTGKLPFTGRNARQLLLQHLQGDPDLGALPEGDRAVVARALSKDPAARFPSCSDFVHALIAGQTEVVLSTGLAQPSGLPGEPAAGLADTHKTSTLKTVRARSLAGRPPCLPGGEPFAGLTFHDLLARTPLTEVWSATAAPGPAGGAGETRRLVKVVFGFTGQQSAARLGALHHGGLIPTEVLHCAPGRLVLSMPGRVRSLGDCRHQCQAQGLPGIPRPLLLRYLRAAGETLHRLAREHDLWHLGLNPRNLLLDSDRLLIADAGLAWWLWLPAGQDVAQLNGRYSAPELFEKRAGPACDQYSLALIYHEMLTGRLPPVLPGAAAPGRAGGPRADRATAWSLDLLPEADRPILARALEPAPERRWPGLLDLVAALEAASPTSGTRGAEAGARNEDKAESPAAPSSSPSSSSISIPHWKEALQTRFGSTLPAEVIRQRLEGFPHQWNGKVVASGPDELVFQMQTPRSFWQRWTGRQPGLEVRIRLTPIRTPHGPTAQVQTEVGVDVRPHDCGREQRDELLEMVGPLLVESVRTTLAANARGRTQERLVWHHPLQVCSIGPDGEPGPAVECQGKDISLNGIGFYLPGQLPSSQILLHLPQTPQTPRMAVPARVVRVQGCGDGWYEVGAVLLPPASEPSVKDSEG